MFTYEQVQKWTAMPKLQVEGEGFAQMPPLRDADLIFWEGAGSLSLKQPPRWFSKVVCAETPMAREPP